MIHDEFLVECPEDMAEFIKNSLVSAMKKAGKPFCETIPLSASASISNHWEH